ncbi:MAG TPA: hypothetical protein DEH78_16155 [Solibacterales bacterium]|nr:hypothetical protein [Bryobacterales bacterium]
MTFRILLLTVAAAAAQPPFPPAEFREGSPGDQLPPHIQRLTWFGERPQFSHDGKRLLFLGAVLGEVYEYEFASKRIKPITAHFRHHGFTRAFYLANGDILLSGPVATFDRTDAVAREEARRKSWLSVLDRNLSKPPVQLGEMCSEGPAVSRKNLRIAWTHRWQQHPERLKEGESQIFTGDIVYQNGAPKLVNRKLAVDSRNWNRKTWSFEVQDFVPPSEDALTLAAYQVDGTTNTDVFRLELATGVLTAMTSSPDWYDEPEGVFPDGKHTVVESAPSRGKPWVMVELWKLALDGSGRKERLTYFTEYKGVAADNAVVSDDGNWMAFQMGRRGAESGEGFGVFLFDLRSARP